MRRGSSSLRYPGPGSLPRPCIEMPNLSAKVRESDCSDYWLKTRQEGQDKKADTVIKGHVDR